MKTAVTKTHSQSVADPSPISKPEPVLVRNKPWKNTAKTRWEISREQESLSDSSLDGLIKRLARVDRTDIRLSAAEGLGHLGAAATPAIPNLLNSAVDVDATVREASLRALDAIDPDWPRNPEARKAFPGLVAAIKSWSTEVSHTAIKLLNIIGQPAVPDLADALLKGEDTVDKVFVIRVLGRIGLQDTSAVPGLIRALGSKTLQVRIAAAETLANIGPLAATAVLALVEGLTDQYSAGRQAMANCLACVGATAEPALPALLPLLADRNDGVRKAAAGALEKIGPQVVPALIEIIQTRDMQRMRIWFESVAKVSQWYAHPKPEIYADILDVIRNLSWTAYEIIDEQASLEYAQEAALGILGKLGPAASAAVPAIVLALMDPNPNIRLAAARALGNIGPGAKAAIPDLTRTLQDDNLQIQAEAAMALTKIELMLPGTA